MHGIRKPAYINQQNYTKQINKTIKNSLKIINHKNMYIL